VAVLLLVACAGRVRGVHIVIVGAGIGGLAAAHAVSRAGHTAHLFERATGSTAVGAGLAMWPNAMRALDGLGFGSAVRDIGAEVRRARVVTATGRPISTLDVAALAREKGAPLVIVERPALHDLLAVGLEVRRGEAVRSVSADGLVLEGGEAVAADAVIGADGIGSMVREVVEPQSRVVATGYTVVRGVGAHDVGAGTGMEAWGPGMVAGLSGLLGGRTYWFLEAASERIDPHDPVALLRDGGWPEPFHAVAAATDRTALLVNDVRTLKPLKRWSAANIALLGDAAHAMAPNLGQGAAQAIEDAAALGLALNGSDDPATAFATYERLRRRRASMVQRESGRMARLALGRNLALKSSVVRLTPDAVSLRLMSRVIG